MNVIGISVFVRSAKHDTVQFGKSPFRDHSYCLLASI